MKKIIGLVMLLFLSLFCLTGCRNSKEERFEILEDYGGKETGVEYYFAQGYGRNCFV